MRIATTTLLAVLISASAALPDESGGGIAARSKTPIALPAAVVDIEGVSRALVGAKGSGTATDRAAPPLVLAWTGVDCPMAKVYAPRLKALAASFAARGVRFLLIDSNAHDSHEELRAFAAAHSLGFPVVRDEGAALARALGATRTTDVFLLDGSGAVRYRGAVDDQYGYRRAEGGGLGTFRRDAPSASYLRDALEAVLAGKAPSPARTEALGCAIGLEWPDEARAVAPESPTFHEHVEPLLRAHCQRCHREGGGAPFALVAYDEVAGWAEMIDEVVTSRRMPPWNADPAVGRFANDPSLSQEAIDTLSRWVAGGSRRGDPKIAPPAKSWAEGWLLPDPDIVYGLPEFEVAAEGRLPYRYVEVKTEFAEDRWIRAAQFRSTGRSVVHHTLTFLRENGPPPAGASRPWTPFFNPLELLQGAEPKDYRTWIRRNRRHLGQLRYGGGAGLNGYFLTSLPGQDMTRFPEGRGRLLPAGATVVFQIHYTPDGTARTSKTELGLWFHDEAPPEAIDVRAASTVVFAIPPGDSEYRVEARSVFPRDGTVLSLRPHMHVRGKSFTYVAVYPDGREETLLHVPRYDFDWQLDYVLAEPLRLPRGAAIKAIGIFDNSAGNPYNPNPDKTVYFGLQSDEEMFIGYYEAIWAQE